MLSRVALSAAVAGGGGLGLTRRVHRRVAVPPPPPPVALTAQLSAQQLLLAGYDAVRASGSSRAGQTARLQADVAAHADALRAVLEQYPGWRLTERPASSSSAAQTAGPSSAAAQTPGPSSAQTPGPSSAHPTASSSSTLQPPAGPSSAHPTASSSSTLQPPAGPGVPTTVGALAAATRRAANLAASNCAAWPVGESQAVRAVPLLGSIAGCLSTHAAILA